MFESRLKWEVEEHKPFLIFQYLVKSLKQLSNKGGKGENIEVVYKGYGIFFFFFF